MFDFDDNFIMDNKQEQQNNIEEQVEESQEDIYDMI